MGRDELLKYINQLEGQRALVLRRTRTIAEGAYARTIEGEPCLWVADAIERIFDELVDKKNPAPELDF